ncbi:hypothetical protein BDQ17DRAFT_1326778 [Cyathus striatus]|nr:hypothetical protein BDQ17DRAFT_1326778 [Cyathus striatus]
MAYPIFHPSTRILETEAKNKLLPNAPCPSFSSAALHATQEQYDATPLLSVRNADRSLSPGDVTYLQPLDMMCILSENVKQAEGSGAIAIIDDSTFVGKQQVLKAFLQNRLAGSEFPAGSQRQLDVPLGDGYSREALRTRYYGFYENMMGNLAKFFD